MELITIKKTNGKTLTRIYKLVPSWHKEKIAFKLYYLSGMKRYVFLVDVLSIEIQ